MACPVKGAPSKNTSEQTRYYVILCLSALREWWPQRGECQMSQTTADAVADYLIKFSHDHGDPITNLKLQKLLYYAQAWYLALHGESLFNEDFEAWILGPVQPTVYRKYKQHRWNPIPSNPGTPRLPDKVKNHLEEVMEVYGGMTAYHLERLTHQEMPWQKARGSTPPDENSSRIISKEDMKQYYRGLLHDKKNPAS